MHLLEQKLIAVLKGGVLSTKEHSKWCDKIYQAKPIVYGHGFYQRRREKLVSDVKFCIPNPKDFSFLIVYVRNFQETDRSLTS